jgi:DNA repair protein RecO (recombination protein O)
MVKCKGVGVPLYESDAFVLRTYKLGETDQIAVLFTREFGKLRAVARRSQSPRRHTASYYQPLTLLRVIVFGRPSQALYRMHSVDIVDALRPLHENFEHLRCGLYVTELIDVVTHEHEPMPELFSLLHQTFEVLSRTSQTTMLLRLFELRLLMRIGYTPQLISCVRCMADIPAQAGAFSPVLGGILCPRCGPAVQATLQVSQATLEFMRLAMLYDAHAWPVPEVGSEVQDELERMLHAHLVTCLGRELKSYAFLHM